MTAYHTTTDNTNLTDIRREMITIIRAGVLRTGGDCYEADEAEWQAEAMNLSELARWAGRYI